MKLILTRIFERPDGIFSELATESGKIVAKTLEHSYDNKPKLYDGEFTCKRGMHRLHGMKNDFETFEVTDVKGHTGILFHVGNYNADSDGCILLGDGIAQSSKGQMITKSKQTFAEFIEMLKGVDSFTLEVRS